MGNSIMVLAPYLYNGIWVFDDESVGLKKEAFVAGADKVLEKLLEEQEIDHPESGFRLIFSDSAFPTHQLEVSWVREEIGGNWYRTPDNMEGWLCQALFLYFKAAPKNLYVRVETIED